LWTPAEPIPSAILAAAADPDTLWVAHNAGFERAVLAHILTPHHGWPAIPVERWACTMARCCAHALPPKLGKAADVLKLAHKKADDKAMHQMATPRRPRGDEDPALGPYWHDDAEHRQALYAYCKQDVACERELFLLLPPLSQAEQRLWELDQVINDRGFYTDGALIKAGIAIVADAVRAVQAEVVEITCGTIETTNQVAKFLAWLAARGCALADLQKGTLAAALKHDGLSPEVRRAIELRLEAAHASANKFEALDAWRCVDGRVRGTFKFHSAATGRWGGAGPQPQNFRREDENGHDPE
jgi:DNA polymerase